MCVPTSMVTLLLGTVPSNGSSSRSLGQHVPTCHHLLLLVWLVPMVTVRTIREAVCLSMSRGLDPVWPGRVSVGRVRAMGYHSTSV